MARLVVRRFEGAIPLAPCYRRTGGEGEEINMDICDSIEIVLRLARTNIAKDQLQEMLLPALIRKDALEIAQQDREIEACNTLEDFAVNHLGDD